MNSDASQLRMAIRRGPVIQWERHPVHTVSLSILVSCHAPSCAHATKKQKQGIITLPLTTERLTEHARSSRCRYYDSRPHQRLTFLFLPLVVRSKIGALLDNRTRIFSSWGEESRVAPASLFLEQLPINLWYTSVIVNIVGMCYLVTRLSKAQAQIFCIPPKILSSPVAVGALPSWGNSLTRLVWKAKLSWPPWG